MRDERETLNNILRSGFKFDVPTYAEFLALARHYREQGFGVVNIKKKIISFCEEHINNFEYITYFELINSASRKAVSKPDFMKISDVSIYDEEIKAIQKFDNFKGQQILFTMLVFAKSQFDDKTIQQWDEPEFLLSSGTRIYRSEFMDNYIHPFHKLGLVNVNMSRGKDIRYYYRLGFVKNSGNLVRIVKSSEIDGCGQVYKEIVNGDGMCSDCGSYFWKTNRRQGRCVDCGMDRRRENVNKAVVKLRKKNK